MALRIGQTLRGSRWDYLLVEAFASNTAVSDVFRAAMMPRAGVQLPGKWAIIKTSSQKRIRDFLKREHNNYMNPVINSCQYFRPMYEAINDYNNSTDEHPYCLAFEYIDCTLKDVPDHRRRDARLHKRIFAAVLRALVQLKSQNLVHTDIKNDNILISGLDDPYPVVKLGDLGLVEAEGFKDHLVQPWAMRAPEVWSGLGCFHTSDVWSLAVTVIETIKPRVFGANDMPNGYWPETWALAKLLRLFPNSVTDHPTDDIQQHVFKIAQMIEGRGMGDGDMEEELLLGRLSIEEEFRKMDMPPTLLEFCRYLFVVDHKRRPTASDALRSRQFHDME